MKNENILTTKKNSRPTQLHQHNTAQLMDIRLRRRHSNYHCGIRASDPLPGKREGRRHMRSLSNNENCFFGIRIQMLKHNFQE